MPPDQVVSPELARHLAEVSRSIGRQVGVFLGREGSVRNVIVGDATKLDLPDVGRLRGGPSRFRGLRLVHTHLRGEPVTQDDLNDLALLRLDMVAAIESLPDGGAGRVEVAYLLPGAADEEAPFQRVVAPDVHRLDLDFEATMAALEAESARVARDSAAVGQERALVIGVSADDERFTETVELVRAAAVAVAGVVRQKRKQVHPRTVIGQGKLEEIVLQGMRRRAEVAIFDVDLKPAQARAFEDATGMKAIDRTQLILDIFAQRARTAEGKLQVELAQLTYLLPRLVGQWTHLERLGGGIGTRGPGETQLESDRRVIRRRVMQIERELEHVQTHRRLQRHGRRRAGVPIVALVGYTNAGKTTLLNRLSGARLSAADQLFVTLDPAARLVDQGPRPFILTDTVGFIRKLPHQLVAAFRATLEELKDADVLLHVIDASHPSLEEHAAAVERTLGELEVADRPMV
ncbi:MAG TPA: GTPase HflX, partial [Thermoanaerobaculia bacterium]|nr:GTPase HflX [Thermoanaerobaculia bacterium]